MCCSKIPACYSIISSNQVLHKTSWSLQRRKANICFENLWKVPHKFLRYWTLDPFKNAVCLSQRRPFAASIVLLHHYISHQWTSMEEILDRNVFTGLPQAVPFVISLLHDCLMTEPFIVSSKKYEQTRKHWKDLSLNKSRSFPCPHRARTRSVLCAIHSKAISPVAPRNVIIRERLDGAMPEAGALKSYIKPKNELPW